MSERTLRTYLVENPRMTGVLFTMLLLLMQTGNAAAPWTCSVSGL